MGAGQEELLLAATSRGCPGRPSPSLLCGSSLTVVPTPDLSSPSQVGLSRLGAESGRRPWHRVVPVSAAQTCGSPRLGTRDVWQREGAPLPCLPGGEGSRREGRTGVARHCRRGGSPAATNSLGPAWLSGIPVVLWGPSAPQACSLVLDAGSLVAGQPAGAPGTSLLPCQRLTQPLPRPPAHGR